MIAKWLLQTLTWIAAMGALLFAPAGTLRWPAAWVFLATMTIIGLSAGSWLASTDPELLAERMRLTARDEQPTADKVFVPVIGGAFLIWFVTIGLDHRIDGLDFPIVVQALGLALMLVSTVFIMWVMRENSFAAPLVKVQRERGHHVVSTGPYAWVRHPMYSGAILFFVGIPLLLSSGWGLAISPLFIVLFAVRTGIEERTLIADLPGYGDYTAQVRYRLLPGVW
ncbi:isoprenylcysteine carboxylmethyltransferase family protein [Bradyrhizobium sp. S69]|uniref:methyltransferase family protein n=1 Tax=Bradyrhizobium sp. S69 TaxID=1641856 RepID=UPI00131E4A9F|nr:isoprenylcysteine carboxylmethyltransferase family protein [Bradyrhizobium sp. S69]